MIGVFKQKTPANILLLALFGVLIKLPMFMEPHVPAPENTDATLYSSLLELLDNASPVVYPILAFILIYLQSIMLTRIMNNHRMTVRASYLPGMCFMLVTSLFPEWNYFSAPLLTNTLLLFLLSLFFRMYNLQQAKGLVFNSGLALGIASFLYFPSVCFLLWVFFALLVMRPFRINEWLLCLLGFTSPYYFYGVYLFLTDQWDPARMIPIVDFDLPSLQQSIWLAVSAFLLSMPFLVGGYQIQNNLRRMLIQVRKGWSMVLLCLLVAVIVPFVNATGGFSNWVMAAIPFAAFHAPAYLYPEKKWFPQLLFWITVAFVLAYQYYGPGW